MLDNTCASLLTFSSLVYYSIIYNYSSLKMSLPEVVKHCILCVQPMEREPEKNTTNTRQHSHGTVVPYKQWVRR
jgi:hypothetical protein